MIRPNQTLYLYDNIPPYVVEKMGQGGPGSIPFHEKVRVMQVQENPVEVPVGSIVRHMGHRWEVAENGLILLGPIPGQTAYDIQNPAGPAPTERQRR